VQESQRSEPSADRSSPAAPAARSALTAPTTRRDFLARASLLGLGVPALGTVLAGCEGEGGEGGARGEGGEREATAEERVAATTAVVPLQRYDPVLPPVGPGREHEFHFVVRDATVAISTDAAMRAWTFNGTVPGPILHVRQGDTVRVHLTNQGTVAHSIDLHAAEIDPGTAFRSISPGQSISYTFTPRHAGAFLYHCGTEPILLHIGNGMFGAIIVDPPTPLPPAREFVLVHNGYYVDRPQDGGATAAGVERSVTVYDSSYKKMLYAFPDYTAFNGYAYQYRLEPLRVKRGERVRFYVVCAGPTQDCAFHVVGEVFDTVYLGTPPGNLIQGVQTFAVPAGGGMIFELTADIPGRFPFVNHKSGHGSKGATGLLIVEP
jgi:nitrite reductase (NO-forming)